MPLEARKNRHAETARNAFRVLVDTGLGDKFLAVESAARGLRKWIKEHSDLFVKHCASTGKLMEAAERDQQLAIGMSAMGQSQKVIKESAAEQKDKRQATPAIEQCDPLQDTAEVEQKADVQQLEHQVPPPVKPLTPLQDTEEQDCSFHSDAPRPGDHKRPQDDPHSAASKKPKWAYTKDFNALNDADLAYAKDFGALDDLDLLDDDRAGAGPSHSPFSFGKLFSSARPRSDLPESFSPAKPLSFETHVPLWENP